MAKKNVYIKSSVREETVLVNNDSNGLNIEVDYIRALCPTKAAYELSIKLQSKRDVIYLELEDIEEGGVYEGSTLITIPLGYSLIIQSSVAIDVYLTYYTGVGSNNVDTGRK